MEALKVRVEKCESDINELKNHRENDIMLINENNKNLAVIITKLENITKSMETLASNWREAIERSNLRQREEHETINTRINNLEKNVINLNNKFESDKDMLEKKVDDRTILKDSNNYQKYIFEIVKYILLAGLGFVLALVLK